MSSFRLLVTKIISERLASLAAQHGVEISMTEFVRINSLKTEDIVSEVKRLVREKVHVVFTSKNAVKAVASIADISKAKWTVYCLEGATKTELIKYLENDSIRATANSAKELASAIIEERNKSGVVFFCGNKRMDDLPQALSSHSIKLTEVIVYKTQQTPKKIAQDFDGVAFFSPSAVESFFSVNQISSDVICFAVGDSTRRAIGRFTSNTVVASESPSEQSVIELAVGAALDKRL